MKPFTTEELHSSIDKLIKTTSADNKDLNINDFSNNITNLILNELKSKTLDYKIIVNSTIISNNIKDDVKQSVGFLISENTDGYYTLKFDNVIDNYDLILNIIYVKT